jgi:hypothetical protein
VSRPALRHAGRAAVVPIAALAVHQLRYLLAYGSAAGPELQRQGHNYLNSVVPWLVLALALAVGGFLSALGRAFAGRTTLPGYASSLAALWLTCSAALLAIYCAQELLEGLVAVGHPAGLAGVFGYGGWWSIPAALSVGLVLAALLHGARWLLREVAVRRSPRRSRAPIPRLAPLRPSPAPRPRLAPLALGWCGRGPPR